MEGWCPVVAAGFAMCPANLEGVAGTSVYHQVVNQYLTPGLLLVKDIVHASEPYFDHAWRFSRLFMVHLQYMIGTLLKVMFLPLQLVFVQPVQWMWTVFLHFFENVVKPLLYFAICAMIVGSLGGVLIGGSFLLIQQMLPSKKPPSTTIY